MFNDQSSLAAFLTTRRSAKPRDLVEPGPSDEDLRRMITIAARSPDHGKLHPWRFIHVPREKRSAFADVLRHAYLRENPNPGRLEQEANDRFAHQAPELIVVLSSPTSGIKIPVWEQELSCGAACMNLLSAATALGYAAGWVTGWAAYNEEVRDAFGNSDERIAGFVFVGTMGAEFRERLRPTLEEVWSEWGLGA
jgi:nitroreductase